MNTVFSKWKLSGTKSLFVLLAVLTVPFFFASKAFFSAFGQSRDAHQRTIKKVAFFNEPIEFTSISSGGVVVQSDKPFTKDGEWLRNLSFEFKNVSTKPIVYVSIALGFPETRTSGPPIGFFLTYGVNPQAKGFPQSGPDARVLLPNESASASLSDARYEVLSNRAQQSKPLEANNVMDYRIMVVYFADGSAFSGGTYFDSDPAHPGSLIPRQTQSGGKKSD